MVPHSGGEDEKKKGGCAWHSSTAQRSGWLAGNQRDSSMSKKGAYLPLPPPLISSAWTCSANTNHTCSHADSLSLPHSLSSLGLAQVESMLSSCAADHGHHAMHACQWPTPPPPHRLAMSVAAPLLHAVAWKEGYPPTACVCVRVCVCHTLHLVRVGAHICVLIVLEAHGCPFSLSLSFFFSPPPYRVEERESRGEGSRAAMQSSHAEQSRAGQ